MIARRPESADRAVAVKESVTSVVASVIVPVFNGAGTLARCLDALTDQDIPRESYQIIVVDDGSTDATAGIARGYSVTYVRQDNRGPAMARNHGARLAAASILLFTDCDCVPARDWISEMLVCFNDPDVVAVKGAYRSHQRELMARFCQIEFEQRFALLEKSPSIDMVDTYSAGYRAQVFRDQGGFDTRFPKADNEDTELSYRMAAKGLKMVFNPRAIVFHLGHPNSVWRYARLKFSRGFWRMVVYKRYPARMVKDSYTPQTLKLQILSLGGCAVSVPTAFWHGVLGFGLFSLSILGFALASTSFVKDAWSKDARVALVSPPLLMVRAAALGLGALAGAAFGRLMDAGGGSAQPGRAFTRSG